VHETDSGRDVPPAIAFASADGPPAWARPNAAVLDCAGARIGGAKRLLNELDLYLRDGSAEVEVVGRGRALTSSWLVRREAGRRTAVRAIALNNVSYQVVGRERRVVVHNALHFLTQAECVDLRGRLRPSMFAQALVVREALRRADTVWVPSSSMAERVRRVLPRITDRLAVRHNPISALPATRLPCSRLEFLCPVVARPYKKTSERLRVLLRACDLLAQPPERVETTLVLTVASAEIVPADLRRHPRLRLIGYQSSEAALDLIRQCAAVVFPFEIESFGYPLAEARAMGVPVVGLASDHNREIAGPALVPYQRQEPEQVAAALFAALRANPPAEIGPAFSRKNYFEDLIG
jgi:glycosyltransferase involved in cell wall biosynthesis